MSPILGIWASQNYSRYSLPTSFDSIATTTVGAGGASSVTFSSIPAGYTHLQIRGIGQESSDTIGIRFNSDSSNNYTSHYVSGDGNSASSAYIGAPTMCYVQTSYGASGGSGRFGVFVVDILDYTNTNKYKTVRSLTGCDNNTVNGKIYLYSGEWYSTSAITSITVTGSTGSTMTQYSSFALYGIKGA